MPKRVSSTQHQYICPQCHKPMACVRVPVVWMGVKSTQNQWSCRPCEEEWRRTGEHEGGDNA
jgi:hypothetical protein